MKKKWTKEDIIRKNETNVKAAGSLYLLSGALCVIYIIRYFIAGNFDFYFSLSFADTFLKLGAAGSIPQAAGYVLTAVFLAIYFGIGVATLKKTGMLVAMLAVFSLDTLCLFFSTFILWPRPESNGFVIDIICHLWVLLFLVVGVRSYFLLKKSGEKAGNI